MALNLVASVSKPEFSLMFDQDGISRRDWVLPHTAREWHVRLNMVGGLSE